MKIKVEHLTKRYLRNEKHFCAIDDVNLTVDQGDFYCIMGESGSGKSTLLNILAGMLKPTEGSVYIDNEELSRMKRKDVDKIRSHKISYLMQGDSLLANLDVEDNINLRNDITGAKIHNEDMVSELIAEVGLRGLRRAYPSELSGGEMRRAAIARALANSPEILVADEPTSNLDAAGAEIIMKLFKRIHKSGTTVIVSTHDAKFMEYATKAYRMSKGTLRECR